MKKNAKKMKKNLHISKFCSNFAPSNKKNNYKPIKTFTIMKTNKLQEKVVARIIKGGFNPKDAVKMVKKYWELSAARDCETVRDYYEAITWFWAV